MSIFNFYNKEDWSIVKDDFIDIKQRVDENDIFYEDTKLLASVKIGDLITDDGKQYDVKYPYYLYSNKDNPAICLINWGFENEAPFSFIISNEEIEKLKGIQWYEKQLELKELIEQAKTENLTKTIFSCDYNYKYLIARDLVENNLDYIYNQTMKEINYINEKVYNGKDMSDVFLDKVSVGKDYWKYNILKGFLNTKFIMDLADEIETDKYKSINDTLNSIMAIEKKIVIMKKELGITDIEPMTKKDVLDEALRSTPVRLVRYLDKLSADFEETLNKLEQTLSRSEYEEKEMD